MRGRGVYGSVLRKRRVLASSGTWKLFWRIMGKVQILPPVQSPQRREGPSRAGKRYVLLWEGKELTSPILPTNLSPGIVALLGMKKSLFTVISPPRTYFINKIRKPGGALQLKFVILTKSA